MATSAFDDTVWYYWVGSIDWMLCTLITFLLTISHAIFMYQDLRTSERKSISHCNAKPKISRSYTDLAVVNQMSGLLWRFKIWR